MDEVRGGPRKHFLLFKSRPAVYHAYFRERETEYVRGRKISKFWYTQYIHYLSDQMTTEYQNIMVKLEIIYGTLDYMCIGYYTLNVNGSV